MAAALILLLTMMTATDKPSLEIDGDGKAKVNNELEIKVDGVPLDAFADDNVKVASYPPSHLKVYSTLSYTRKQPVLIVIPKKPGMAFVVLAACVDGKLIYLEAELEVAE